MTVKEFLERQKGKPKDVVVNLLTDLLTLLDEMDSEKCSTLAGKIRARMPAAVEGHCPACHSPAVVYRKTTDDFRCKDCGEIFTAKL